MNDEERHAQGMEIRNAVLGKEHVQRAVDATTAFDAPFQDLITRYAWGEIWGRPGLPRQTRSLLTLAMMVALGRADELRLHLRAAGQQRRHPRPDPGSASPGCPLLRRPGRKSCLPSRRGSLRPGRCTTGYRLRGPGAINKVWRNPYAAFEGILRNGIALAVAGDASRILDAVL